MSAIAILKLLKTAKDIHDYVKKPNNLDAQNESFLARMDIQDKKIDSQDIEIKVLREAFKELQIRLKQGLISIEQK